MQLIIRTKADVVVKIVSLFMVILGLVVINSYMEEITAMISNMIMVINSEYFLQEPVLIINMIILYVLQIVAPIMHIILGVKGLIIGGNPEKLKKCTTFCVITLVINLLATLILPIIIFYEQVQNMNGTLFGSLELWQLAKGVILPILFLIFVKKNAKLIKIEEERKNYKAQPDPYIQIEEENEELIQKSIANDEN